jgi:hypothetical protein
VPFFGNIRDVGARHKRLAACPGEDHDTHAIVVREVFDRLSYRLPHFEGHCVVVFGIVDRDGADLAILTGQDLFAHSVLNPLLRRLTT